MRKISENSKLSLQDIGDLHGWEKTRSSKFNQEVKRILGKPKTAKITVRDIAKALPDYDVKGILHCLNSKKKVFHVGRGYSNSTWT